jgi:hypothetical protein
MRRFSLSAAAAAALTIGAASAAFASPAGSTLPAGANLQTAAEQAGGGRDCYWRYGRYHCDRGYHRGWGYEDWRWRRHRDRW